MSMNVNLNSNSVSVRGGNVSADLGVNRSGSIGTPKKSFAQKLGGFAKNVAGVGLSVVGAAVPGASVLTNALQGALGGSASGNFGATDGLNGQSMMREMQQMNFAFLALQNATQNESRRFQTLSNASKAKQDVALNAIRNMK